VTEADKVRSDIELTRAELADTVDALRAKLDVTALARRRAEELESRAFDGYARAKAAAPPPVRVALDKVEQVAAPVLSRAAQDKKRAAAMLGGTLLSVLNIRRLRRS
jgi:hypothetical protein